MAYKNQSDKNQARLTRAIPRRFGSYPDECLTDDEYRALLKTKVAEIERRLAMMKHGPERKALGIKKQELATELFHLSGKRQKPGKTLANAFMDVCRRELTKDQFEFLSQLAVLELRRFVDEKQGKGSA